MRDNGAPTSSRQRLIESLWQDARREAEQQVQKARLKAENLLEESRRFFEREMALAVERAHREALPHVSRIQNRARNRARQLILEERLAFLNSCFDDVAGGIRENKHFLEKARVSFEHLFDQALSAMGDPGKVEVSLNPQDLPRANPLLEEKGLEHHLVADETIIGGVILRARGGSMVVDDTMEGRLEVLRETPPIDLLRLICPNQDR